MFAINNSVFRKPIPAARKIVERAFDELEQQERAASRLERRERRRFLLAYRARKIASRARRRQLVKIFAALPVADQIELLEVAMGMQKASEALK